MPGASVDEHVAGIAAAAGSAPHPLVAITRRRGVGVGLAIGTTAVAIAEEAADRVVTAVEASVRPRWVAWSNATASELLAGGVRLARAWDVAAVHRLLFGGFRAEPARVWARLHDRSATSIPGLGQLGLLDDPGDEGDDPAQPTRPDGHRRPEWAAGGWAEHPERLAQWAGTALDAAAAQHRRLLDLSAHPVMATVRSESAAELLATELSADGLPLDRTVVSALLADAIGPRPHDAADEAARRHERDATVLAHAPLGGDRDLRNPAHVRSLLRRVGVDVSDTRAWRLEPLRDAHPFVDALLRWRKAERMATTYGYHWLDEHVGPDGRLRGPWTASDGAAGRMTAGAGLHSLPSELRSAVVAESGHVFVRADLGQIEPRVLAAVSGDEAFARAARTGDLYAPVAQTLGVTRDTAKVAVLAAMYGQRSGTAGQALAGMERAYPTAIAYLDAADRDGQLGREVRTYGGRLIRMGDDDSLAHLSPDGERRARAARGRYARNAMVQGAAAELFKAWAATVRSRLAGSPARIVLCLHDELLVHAPIADGPAVASAIDEALQEAARRWRPPGVDVRFVTDTSVLTRWSDAK